jgi:hypothetical protein
MALQTCQEAVLRAAFAACLLACTFASVFAGEASYCVTCKNPDQTYLCRVSAGGSKPIDALKLYCVIRTVQEDQHSSCSAERATPSCNGAEKNYSYDGRIPEEIASDRRIKSFTDKIEQNQRIFEKPKSNQPNTLVELTGRAVSASRQGWRNTRDRLGGSSQEINQSLPEEPLSLDQAAPPMAGESSPVPVADERPNRMQRAGNAVGGFARKSYRCVLSLFRSCGTDGDEISLSEPQ